VQVNLSWQPVTGAFYYNIYRGVFTGGPYDLIGQSNPNQSQTPSLAQTTYIDGPYNLENGQNYYYVVSAVTFDGESSYGTEFAVTVPAQPASPLSLTGIVT
jgi:hypothetical protein